MMSDFCLLCRPDSRVGKNGGIIDDRIWNKQYITEKRKDDKEYSKSVITKNARFSSGLTKTGAA